MIVWFLSLWSLTWYITFINFHMRNYVCIFGIEPTESWWMIYLILSCQSAGILMKILRLCLSQLFAQIFLEPFNQTWNFPCHFDESTALLISTTFVFSWILYKLAVRMHSIDSFLYDFCLLTLFMAFCWTSGHIINSLYSSTDVERVCLQLLGNLSKTLMNIFVLVFV